MEKLTSLGRTEVLARGRGTRASTSSLLNAQRATLNHLTLETFLSSLGLLRGDHLDEAEATRLLSMRVTHDLTLFDIAIFLEHLGNLGFGKTRVNAGDEKV
jgi:hypothetical protein